MPPEPNVNSPQGRALPTQPLPVMPGTYPPPDAYQPPAFPASSPLPPPPDPSPQDLAGPPRARIGPRRLVGGVIWAGVTVICGVGGVAELAVGVTAGGVLCLIIAAGTGWFDYRIWRPRRPRDPR